MSTKSTVEKRMEKVKYNQAIGQNTQSKLLEKEQIRQQFKESEVKDKIIKGKRFH